MHGAWTLRGGIWFNRCAKLPTEPRGAYRRVVKEAIDFSSEWSFDRLRLSYLTRYPDLHMPIKQCQ